VGFAPNDQPETQALVNFTQRVRPVATLSLHARGRELYHDFFAPPQNVARDQLVANKILHHLNAKIPPGQKPYQSVSTQGTSAGGYKDWCIQELGIPSLTLELFEDQPYPIPQDKIQQEYAITKDLIATLAHALE